MIALPGEMAPFPRSVILSPNGTRLYVALAARPCCGLLFDEISVVDTTTWQQVDRLILPQRASHLAVSGDGQILYVVSPDTQQLFYFDADTGKQWGMLEGLGKRPFQLLANRGP